MSTIFGLAKLVASDYAYVNNANQELIYTATQQYIAMANEAAMRAVSTFVEPVPTTNFKERYKLPMNGRMQKTTEETNALAVAQSGSWDVAYPLDNFSDAIARSDVDGAYMTPAEFQMHIDGVITRANNAKRHEILYRMFNNTQDEVVDKRHGALTIEPLANGDSVTYPPVEGSDTEATENHYLETGYAATAISDTDNPFRTAADDLIHHGVNTTDDIPIAHFINPAEQPETEALTGFIEYVPPQIQRGADTDQVLMPSRPLPGKVIGYIGGMGWVSVWNWIPANYMISVNLAAPQPLRMRVDPAETGLGSGGLQLLPEERYGQITYNAWRLRFGIGAANRLSGVVTEFGTGGTYTVPAAYA